MYSLASADQCGGIVATKYHKDDLYIRITKLIQIFSINVNE